MTKDAVLALRLTVTRGRDCLTDWPTRRHQMATANVGKNNDPAIAKKQYVHPELLVSTDWLAEHLNDPDIRIVESDEDVLLYNTGHIPGAQKVDWHEDLNDPVLRDYVSSAQF